MPIVLPDTLGVPEAEGVGADGAVLEPAEDGTCRECCEPSLATLDRWCPCDLAGCWPQHADIWIRSGTVPCADGTLIIVDGWCYFGPRDRRTQGQLPPGAVIVPAGRVSCSNVSNCDAAPCRPPTGGDCPCGCEAVCSVVVNPRPRPGHPEDPPCQLCCFGRPMVFSYRRTETTRKRRTLLIPDDPFACSGGSFCEFFERDRRSIRPWQPGDGDNFLCTSGEPGIGNHCPDCCDCYLTETRTVQSGCENPAQNFDSGWSQTNSLILGLIGPPTPSDSGWVRIGQSQNICGVELYSERRIRMISSCNGFVGITEDYVRLVGQLSPNGCVACLEEQWLTDRVEFSQGGPSSNCCGGCRQEVCGDVLTGGGCPQLAEPAPPPIEGAGPIDPGSAINLPTPLRRNATSVPRQTPDRSFGSGGGAGCGQCGGGGDYSGASW